MYCSLCYFEMYCKCTHNDCTVCSLLIWRKIWLQKSDEIKAQRRLNDNRFFFQTPQILLLSLVITLRGTSLQILILFIVCICTFLLRVVGSWTQHVLRRRQGNTLYRSSVCRVNKDKHMHSFGATYGLEQAQEQANMQFPHATSQIQVCLKVQAPKQPFLVILKTWRHLWNISDELKGLSKWNSNWSINNSWSFLHLGTCHDNLLDVTSLPESPRRQQPLLLFPFYAHCYTCVL